MVGVHQCHFSPVNNLTMPSNPGDAKDVNVRPVQSSNKKEGFPVLSFKFQFNGMARRISSAVKAQYLVLGWCGLVQ